MRTHDEKDGSAIDLARQIRRSGAASPEDERLAQLRAGVEAVLAQDSFSPEQVRELRAELARMMAGLRAKPGKFDRIADNDGCFAAMGGGFWAWLCPGGVVALGGEHGIVMEMEVEEWREITALAAGRDCLLGLRQDGTVDVSAVLWTDAEAWSGAESWRDIVQITAWGGTCVGVNARGEVSACGEHSSAILGALSDGVAVDPDAPWRRSVALGEDGLAWRTIDGRFGWLDLRGGASFIRDVPRGEGVPLRLSGGEQPRAPLAGRELVLAPGTPDMELLYAVSGGVRALWAGSEVCYAVDGDGALRWAGRVDADCGQGWFGRVPSPDELRAGVMSGAIDPSGLCRASARFLNVVASEDVLLLAALADGAHFSIWELDARTGEAQQLL